MKRFATFETSSHFKFFDFFVVGDFASKASSCDVLDVVALLLVVVLRFLLRVLAFVFLRAVKAVINGGTDDDDFDEQHFFVESVVAVVRVVVAKMVVVTMKRDRFFINNGKSLSLSLLVIHKQKRKPHRERESFQQREKEKKQFRQHQSAFRVCYYTRIKSRFSRRVFQQILCLAFFKSF